jgi:K+-sensing histidine kinase KdpD
MVLFLFGGGTSVKRVFLRLRTAALGLGFCTAAALVVTGVSVPRPWRVFVPFAFIAVIVLLAARYGMWVAVLGSVVTSLIFAYFIFPPLHSFRVEDKMERSAIAWMILGGVVVSFLLIPIRRPRQR